MLLIDPTYFTGELSIPELPTSRIGEGMATFGSAYAIQTVGENNLEIFIDEKVREYLYLMLGHELTEDLILQAQGVPRELNREIKTDIGTYFSRNISGKKNIFWDGKRVNVRSGWLTIKPDQHSQFTTDPTYASYRFRITLDNETVSKIDFKVIRDERVGMWRTLEYEAQPVLGNPEYGAFGSLLLRVSPFEAQLRVLGRQVSAMFINTTDTKTHKAHSRTPYIQSTLPVDAPRSKYRKLLNVLLTYKGTTKVSPLANYVWYWLYRDGSNYTTAMGEADLNFSRASNAYEADKRIKMASQRNKLIRAWNDMAKMSLELSNYLRYKSLLHKEYNIPFQNHRQLTKTINQFGI